MRPRRLAPERLPLAISALVLSLAVLIGCTSAAAPSPTPLVIEGVWWRAVSVNGVAPRAGAEPRFRLAGERIEGTTGCNSFGGNARVVDGRLEAPELAMTLIGCEEAIAAVERQFTSALAGAALTSDGTTLILAAPGTEIVLVPGEPPPVR